MFRHIFRTSRHLVRREINIRAFNLPRSYSHLNFIVKHNIKISTGRYFSTDDSKNTSTETEINSVTYDQICNETLESLCEYFEQIIDNSPNLKGADVTYGDGVLTVSLGPNYGTYVINRQSPNKQIWLSSPKSGPKRYDLILKDGGYWIYKHDGVTLHQLLQSELSKIVDEVNFKDCSHSFI